MGSSEELDLEDLSSFALLKDSRDGPAHHLEENKTQEHGAQDSVAVELPIVEIASVKSQWNEIVEDEGVGEDEYEDAEDGVA
jgi:hypothetical protein